VTEKTYPLFQLQFCRIGALLKTPYSASQRSPLSQDTPYSDVSGDPLFQAPYLIFFLKASPTRQQHCKKKFLVTDRLKSGDSLVLAFN